VKTNVPIDLTDAQRSELANMLDGKVTQRLATRKEIVKLCEAYIAGLVGEDAAEAPVKPQNRVVLATCQNRYDPSLNGDDEDRDHLAGKSEGYIRGWNMVKNRNR